MAEPPVPLRCDEARSCVIIPVYNNVSTVGDVVRGVLDHCSAVLVCDDGSTDGSGDVAEAAGAMVLRHPRNEGKGVALRTLLAEAHRQGFRHAISMDADGQHFPGDLPAFAAALIDEPGSMVLGVRDLIAAGAPPSSEFGRRCSNWWIWFETGLNLPDTQSGFRGYPVPEVSELGAGHRRYEFETDVLLRAAWAGIPIRSRPIKVLYPANRISHFRLVLDNVRIVALNTVAVLRHPLPLPLGKSLFRVPRRPGWSLFEIRRWAWLGGCGPLWRGLAALAGVLGAGSFAGAHSGALTWATCAAGGIGALPALLATHGYRWLLGKQVSPVWSAVLVVGCFVVFGVVELARAPRRSRPTGWTGKSRGGVFGHWFFITITRAFGRSVAYGVIYPVTLYFLFAAPAARTASRQFLARAVGPAGWLQSMVRSYRHLLAFARTMVDRALLRTRGKTAFRYVEQGLHHIHQAASAGRGAVLLTAHMGNWELAAGLLSGTLREKLALAAYQGEREAIAQFMKRSGGPELRVIEVGRDVLATLEMIRELRGGTLLAVHGDRAIGEQTVSIPFLGREARFPIGPFLLAAVSGAPLIATFSLQLGPAEYRFFAQEPQRLSFSAGQDRETQLAAWVRQYVSLLESLARQYPYQWFNFYDFWDASPPPLVSRTQFATGEAA
ncbi:MAG TPA: glycosyltransferase [Myxococcaceae bacterium]|nr:glycosyltransferase [Myxococcaceae bacterium]